MTRLEDLLRDSLADRAEDVRATPDLWHRVEARTVARARRRWAMATVGTALSVAAAAVFLPGMLERTPERPGILVDPDPTPASGDATPGDESGAAADPAATHMVAVRDGILTWFEVGDLDAPRLRLAVDGEVGDMAVRPHAEGGDWHVAWTTRVDGFWELHLVDVPDEVVVGRSAGGGDDVVVAKVPAEDGATGTPGLAWSPDGGQLAWMVHQAQEGGGSTAEVQVFGWQEGIGNPNGQYATGVPIRGQANLRVADWTWDATYEDGMVGRLLLVDDERAWQARITRDATGIVDVDDPQPLSASVDADQAGPVTGPLLLTLGNVPSVEDAILAVTDLDGRVLHSWTDPLAAPVSGDLAAAGGLAVVALSDRLLRFEGNDFSEYAGAWGPVDLVTAPWLAAFQSAEDDPADDRAAAPRPEFGVRALSGRVEVVRNWFGEGEPEVVRDLGSVPALEGAAVHGITVRPGSTVDDLEAVVLALHEGMYEFWWLSSVGDQVRWEQFDAAHQPWAAAGQPQLPVPVFSPDHPSGARHLAWIDQVGDGGESPRLRVVGWVDGAGPGTGDPASDNAAWDLPPGPAAVQLDDWRWGVDGDPDRAELLLTTPATDGQQASELRAGVERQADGAIALVNDCFCGEPGHGSHTHEAVSWQGADGATSRAALVAGADGLALLSTDTAGQPRTVVLPPALRDHPEPATLELRLVGTTAVVVDRGAGLAWALDGDGLDSFDAQAFDLVD